MKKLKIASILTITITAMLWLFLGISLALGYDVSIWHFVVTLAASAIASAVLAFM